jgi:hypothetical protein
MHQYAFAGVDRVRRQVHRVGQLRRGEALAADAQVAQTGRGIDREAAGDRAVGLGNRLVAIASARVVGVRNVDGRHAVGVAVDGDGQDRRRAAAVAVGQGVGVAVGQGLAVVQRIDRRIGIVQRVGVAAVGCSAPGCRRSAPRWPGSPAWRWRRHRRCRHRHRAARCRWPSGPCLPSRRWRRSGLPAYCR